MRRRLQAEKRIGSGPMEFGEYMVRQRPALMRFATVLTCQTWLSWRSGQQELRPS